MMNQLRKHQIQASVFLLLATLSFNLVAETAEERRGREAHEQLSEFTHFYTDEKVNAYVREIGEKLVANSEWADREFHFFIVDSGGINAFAIQGGYVYINRGLLSYLTSEAQLAAVLAHEIAHVTKRHTARQTRQQTLGGVAAFIASLATFNGDIGDAIRLENSVRVSGFGREMELEADEFGASYLYKTGYDPEALVEVLGILKDHQTFSALQSRAAGGSPQTYHGVFASHPRNDQRLREVIDQAGQLPPGEAFVGRTEFRQIIDGIVFGENDNSVRPPGYERYASRGLRVTFAYPDSWQQSISDQTIMLNSDEGIELHINVTRPSDISLPAEELLLSEHQITDLTDAEGVYDEDRAEEDEALMGIEKAEDGDKRVALVKLGANAYFFESQSPSPLSEEADEAIVKVIRSFRPAEPSDFPPSDIKNVTYRQLAPGETFAELAQAQSLGRYTEDFLRLINGYYPQGEAQPGTWIKTPE